MQDKDFQKFHKKPTPTIKKIPKIVVEMLCSTNCTNTCRFPCKTPPNTYTLAPRANQNFTHNPNTENKAPKSIQNSPKPLKKMMNLQNYSITSITNKKTYKKKKKY